MTELGFECENCFEQTTEDEAKPLGLNGTELFLCPQCYARILHDHYGDREPEA